MAPRGFGQETTGLLASQAQPAWDATPAEQRAACLEGAAQLLEERRGVFLRLLVKEAGKTLPDAV